MKRPSNSVLIAVGVAVAVTAWMLTGLGRARAIDDAKQASDEAQATAVAVPRVAVTRTRARTITREITISGRTEPNRTVELRAETAGRVVALGAERGSAVAAGDTIASLDVRDRAARRDEARALITQAELQLEAARTLKERQFVADTQLAELAARVAAARSALRTIELEISNTTIAAPFDAVLQERAVELGDYVNEGDEVALLVDTDPLVVVGDVAERNVGALTVGNAGVAVVAGEPVAGRIRYIAPVADESTRTFRVELATPNADGARRGGMSAELRLAAGEHTVHVLSAALLTLDDAGVVGVKAVDASKRVRFYPVEVVASEADGLSVTGLPQELDLITVGQGYVRPGDLVEPSSADQAGLSDASSVTAGSQSRR